MPKSNKRKPDWSAVRAKGRANFVFKYGILFYGIYFSIMMAVINYFRRYGLTFDGLGAYLSRGWLYLELAWNCLFFGTGMGLFYWYAGEWHYKRRKKDKDRAD